MGIKDLFEKTKSNQDMLSEYKKNGEPPLYLYVVKQEIIEEVFDGKGGTYFENTPYIKGLSLSSKTEVKDEIIDEKILVPFDYAKTFKDKTLSMDVLFIDLMSNNSEKFKEIVSKEEGLDESDFVYKTFIDNYKNRYIQKQGVLEKTKSILETIQSATVSNIKEIKENLKNMLPSELSDKQKSNIIATAMVVAGGAGLVSLGPEEELTFEDYKQQDHNIEIIDSFDEQKTDSTYVLFDDVVNKKTSTVVKVEENKVIPKTKIEEVRKRREAQNKKTEEAKKAPISKPVVEKKSSEKISRKVEPLVIKDLTITYNPSAELKNKVLETKNSIKGIGAYSDRYKEFFKNLIGEEGGYGTNDNKEIKKLREQGIKVNKIDQPTKFGITQKTLKKLKKDYPNLYKNIDHVRDLDLSTAKFICHKSYYQPYKIEQIKDKVLAEQFFDIMYNHAYKTGRNKFIIGAINNLEKSKDNKAKSFKDWSEIVEHCNSLNDLETAKLNVEIATLRDDFMNEPGRVKSFKGLLLRSKKWKDLSENNLDIIKQHENSVHYASNHFKSKGEERS